MNVFMNVPTYVCISVGLYVSCTHVCTHVYISCTHVCTYNTFIHV